MLNHNFHLKDQGVSNALSIGELPRHRWYFIKEGFSPKLVEQAITTDGARKGDLLLDPFSGSGTAPLAAVTAGLKTVGFEVNPFLRFLSATKLLQADTKKLARSTRLVTEGLKQPQPSPLENYSTFTDGKNNRWGHWLFSRKVLRSYEGARQELKNVPTEHRGLLKIALLGAAMDCCNATRDGKCLRYKKDWQDHECGPKDIVTAFNERMGMLAEDLEKTPLLENDARIIGGDTRKLIEDHPTDKFRLCVTSPPYLNSFDYSDVYRPELFLGGFVTSNHTLMKVRLNTVRSHVQASWEKPKKKDFGVLYQNSIRKIRAVSEELWDKRIPLMVQAYFEDMDKILAGLRKRALSNASIWFVVSTSAYGGVYIPVDLILADIGQRCGWYLREVGVLRYLRSSGQQMNDLSADEISAVPLRESVVIFDANPKARRHLKKKPAEG